MIALTCTIVDMNVEVLPVNWCISAGKRRVSVQVIDCLCGGVRAESAEICADMTWLGLASAPDCNCTRQARPYRQPTSCM
jgi:hypothetical protein